MPDQLPLDSIVSFCRDMVAQCGEDSYCHCFCDNAGLLGVFDGCGGAGARKHEFYSGKTEAYMASRLCAGGFYDTFRQMFSENPPAPERIGEQFGANTIELLKKYQPPTDDTGFRIMGSMVRTLPTTAAAAVIQQGGSWRNIGERYLKLVFTMVRLCFPI